MPRPCDVAAVLLLLSGCAATVPATSDKVKPAAADQVAGCRYIDDVAGTSGWYGLNASLGVENARAEALKKDEAIGGNRIVWAPAALGHGSTAVSAKVYSCT